jgi:3-oxoacyl-[acyl-carrier-protein] synthase II
MADRRVVITGLGVVNSLGIGQEAYWEKLCRGDVGVERIQSFDASGFPSQIAGEAPQVKMDQYVPKAHRKATKLMSRDIQLAVIAADDAIRDAQLVTKGTDPEAAVTLDPTRSGVNIGAGLICCDLVELGAAAEHSVNGEKIFDLNTWGKEGMESLTPLWLLKYLPNMLSCHISIIHDLQGPSNSITCGDASGLLAIGEAYHQILHDKADLMITGGAESKVNGIKLMRHCFQKVACEDYNDRASQASRPFDRDASGTAVGEGAGVVVLEELEHARNRGALIYGEIKGFGASCNFSEDYVRPESQGTGIAIALQKALKKSGVAAEQIQLLIPSGAAVRSHDAAEASGVREAFGSHSRRLAIFASKGQIGHCGAAGAAIDFIHVVLSLKNNVIPQTINCPNPVAEYGLNINNEERLETSLEQTATCSYTFGGQTAAMVISKL